MVFPQYRKTRSHMHTLGKHGTDPPPHGKKGVQLKVRGINLCSELKNHPEGMPSISRWLRPKADTTGVRAGGSSTPAGVAPEIDPVQAVIPPGSISGFHRTRGYGFAKLPANSCRSSGSPSTFPTALLPGESGVVPPHSKEGYWRRKSGKSEF